MLTQLSIKNIATIYDISIDFCKGMTVITGDTGAGKSLILSALNLIIANKAHKSLIRTGCDRAEVLALFDIKGVKNVQKHLIDYELLDEDNCIIRRIITSDGKSKAMINNITVPLSVLRLITNLLIDIYGQNDQQNIIKVELQCQILDDYIKNDSLLKKLNNIVEKYNKNQQQILKFKQKQAENLQKLELLNYQLLELNEANLDDLDIENIEQNYKISANLQNLLITVATVHNELDNDIYNKIINITTALEKLITIDKKLQPILELISSAQIQLQEASYDTTNYLEKIAINEQENSKLEQDITKLNSLARKHNCQIPELINIRNHIDKQIIQLSSADKDIEKLSSENKELTINYKKYSTTISTNREKSANKLAQEISKNIQKLGMANASFKIHIDNSLTGIRKNGNDIVSFLVLLNIGSDYKKLAQVASGGELSRINLAISVATNNKNITPTLFFDEIDLGISGGVAQIVGLMLNKLAKKYQILCITHLAQVASQGDNHLLVQKKQINNNTNSTITAITGQNRVLEIARILDGVKIGKDALKVAKNLLNSRI